MAENTDVLPNTPTPGNIEQIALQIKSLEQRTTSVTLPRNASVLELKQEIQVAFDVESNRQRLIFQGRVLKDDKNLTDYANLDNGKVIHLVIRPIDAPHNPQNDDPNPRANVRRTAGGRFPPISSRFPMMEGYAFITLDSNLGDIGDNQSLWSSVLSGLSTGGLGSGLNRSRSGNSAVASSDTHATGLGRTSSTASTTSTGSNSGTLPRSAFSFNFGRSNSSEFASPLASTPPADRLASGLPFPPSVEVRLARTLGSMRNVRTMLEDTGNNDEPSHFSTTTPNSTPEQLQEIRNRLRTSGNNQPAQIGMVLNELADLMTEAAPRMREVSQSLRQENQTTEEERNTSRRVLNMSRIVQGMSLINHFLGSVLASADIDSRRTATNNASSTSTTSTTSTASSSAPSLFSSARLTTPPSFFSIRGNTEAIRTPAPSVDTRSVTPNDSTSNTSRVRVRVRPTRSTLSNATTNPSSTAADSSSSSSSSGGNASRGVKRTMDQVKAEEDSESKKIPKSTTADSSSGSSSSSSSDSNASRDVKRRMDQVKVEEDESNSKEILKTEKGKEKDKKD